VRRQTRMSSPQVIVERHDSLKVHFDDTHVEITLLPVDEFLDKRRMKQIHPLEGMITQYRLFCVGQGILYETKSNPSKREVFTHGMTYGLILELEVNLSFILYGGECKHLSYNKSISCRHPWIQDNIYNISNVTKSSNVLQTHVWKCSRCNQHNTTNTSICNHCCTHYLTRSTIWNLASFLLPPLGIASGFMLIGQYHCKAIQKWTVTALEAYGTLLLHSIETVASPVIVYFSALKLLKLFRAAGCGLWGFVVNSSPASICAAIASDPVVKSIVKKVGQTKTVLQVAQAAEQKYIAKDEAKHIVDDEPVTEEEMKEFVKDSKKEAKTDFAAGRFQDAVDRITVSA
jgi:hypothetical protein